MQVINALELLEKNIRLCTVRLTRTRRLMLQEDTEPGVAEKLLQYANALYLEQLRLLETRERLIPTAAATLFQTCGAC
jgi:hypothetical protein